MASLGVMSKKHPAFMAEEAIGVIIASDKDINAERFNGMNQVHYILSLKN